MIDVFLICRNKNFPAMCFQSSHLKGRCIPTPMGPHREVPASLIHHHKKSAQQGHGIRRPVSGSHSSFAATEKVVSQSVVSAGGMAPTTLDVLEPAGSTTHSEVSSGSVCYYASHLKVIKQPLRKTGFAEKASARADSHYRKSSANIY